MRLHVQHNEQGQVDYVYLEDVPEWMSDIEVADVCREEAEKGNRTFRMAVNALDRYRGKRWYDLLGGRERVRGNRLYLDGLL